MSEDKEPKPFTAVTAVSWLLALGLIVTGALVTQQLDEQNRKPTCVMSKGAVMLQSLEQPKGLASRERAMFRRKNALEPYAGRLDGKCRDTELYQACDGDLACTDGVCKKLPEGVENGPCYGNDTCNEALVCQGNICTATTEEEDGDWLAGVTGGEK